MRGASWEDRLERGGKRGEENRGVGRGCGSEGIV